MRRVLLGLTTGVAVFAAMFASFWRPDRSVEVGSQFEVHGFGVVLLFLIPAAIATAPLFATPRARTLFTTAVAVLLTALSFFFPEGWIFAPVALLAWAALGAPVIARHGRPAAGWRIAAGALTAVPGAGGLAGVVGGSWELTIESLLVTLASFSVGVLIALGMSWAGIVLALGGAVLLVDSALNPGMLTLAVWWAGGLFIALGAGHFLTHARPRTPARA
jgi:hypothetical protein